jgi:hypothetical protein
MVNDCVDELVSGKIAHNLMDFDHPTALLVRLDP